MNWNPTHDSEIIFSVVSAVVGFLLKWFVDNIKFKTEMRLRMAQAEKDIDGIAAAIPTVRARARCQKTIAPD